MSFGRDVKKSKEINDLLILQYLTIVVIAVENMTQSESPGHSDYKNGCFVQEDTEMSVFIK